MCMILNDRFQEVANLDWYLLHERQYVDSGPPHTPPMCLVIEPCSVQYRVSFTPRPRAKYLRTICGLTVRTLLLVLYTQAPVLQSRRSYNTVKASFSITIFALPNPNIITTTTTTSHTLWTDNLYTMKLTLALTALLATAAMAGVAKLRHEDENLEDSYRRRSVKAGIVPVKEEDIISLGDRAVKAGIVPVKEEDIISLGDRSVKAGIVPVKEEDIISLGDRAVKAGIVPVKEEDIISLGD